MTQHFMIYGVFAASARLTKKTFFPYRVAIKGKHRKEVGKVSLVKGEDVEMLLIRSR